MRLIIRKNYIRTHHQNALPESHIRLFKRLAKCMGRLYLFLFFNNDPFYYKEEQERFKRELDRIRAQLPPRM